MEYISAEEFLKQDKEVQEVFQEWWKPMKFDIYVDRTDTTQEECFNFLSEGMLNHSMSDNLSYRRDMIPLLTEGQLRKFIEDKTGCRIEIVWDGLDYDIYLVEELTGDPTPYDYLNLGENLLQAYWKVACEIAKEV